ncbi:MAG: response regulator transcription factor [Armatimonadetes bacterium]|nr:response regulator transcription factor [Armatimonadota bacterium]
MTVPDAEAAPDATSPKKAIRVLIADDHYLVRAGLISLISRNPQMVVVAEAVNGQEAVRAYRTHRPDIVLMDLRMPVMDGLKAMVAIRAIHTGARILVLTSFDGDEYIFKGLQAGARGYCLKDATADELYNAIMAVYSGQRAIPPEIAAKLVERINGNELTSRESEVLSLIATGKTNHQIGTALFITEGTVKTHVNNILTKMNARDRTEAVIMALKRGLITL